jgi:hypothetical protein
MTPRRRAEKWDNWEHFEEEALREANNYMTNAMASNYIDILVERGYIVGKGERLRATPKFSKLVMAAGKALRKRKYSTDPDEDLTDAFGWEMARIILHLDESVPLEEDVNPKELGGLAVIIGATIQSFSIPPDLLMEAYEGGA